MAKKTAIKTKGKVGKIAAEIGAGLVAAGAAATATYYLYGSKNAKKNRKVITKELKADWKILQNEAKKIKINSADISRAKAIGRRLLADRKVVLARGKKVVKKIAKQAKVAIKKSKSR